MYKNIFIKILFLGLILSGCSTKSSTGERIVDMQNECGEGTIIQGTIIGSITGGITSQLIQTNPIVSAVVGGIFGTVGGYKLASMQCQYQDAEYTLLKKIKESIQKQNHLSSQINSLNRRMSILYSEINLLKNKYQMTLSKKEHLQNKITLKKEEISKIQALNNDVIFITENYYRELEARNYTKTDKKNIKHSLNKVLASLGSIKKSCIYNLEQLNQFESRVY